MRKNNLVLGITAVCLTILLPDASQATIYSYVDQDGAVHFTNVPNDSRYRPWSRSPARLKGSANHYQYEPYIRDAARLYEVDPLLVKAVIKAESDFDCFAISKKGAKGLMQLMPETMRDMNVADPFDPEANILGGTCYLRKLLDLFEGDLQLTLAAYNAGPNRVKELGRMPRITETKKYVSNVLANYKRYKNGASPYKTWVKIAYD